MHAEMHLLPITNKCFRSHALMQINASKSYVDAQNILKSVELFELASAASPNIPLWESARPASPNILVQITIGFEG